MAGRAKIKCYEYNSEGKYLQEYESQQEVRNKYFSSDIGKRPLLKSGIEDYFKLQNGNFIANYRIGRDKLIKLERIKNCIYCNDSGNIKNQEVEVYNLKNELIATFKNSHFTSVMLKIDLSTLHSRVNSISNIRNTPNKDNLEFKYKK